MEENECPICRSSSRLMHEDLKLLGGKVVIKNSPYYKCKKCGEEFATSEQMQELSDKISIERQKFFFKRPIINAGRSLAITLPSDIVHKYSLKKGNIIKIIPENDTTLTLKL